MAATITTDFMQTNEAQDPVLNQHTEWFYSKITSLFQSSQDER